MIPMVQFCLRLNTALPPGASLHGRLCRSDLGGKHDSRGPWMGVGVKPRGLLSLLKFPGLKNSIPAPDRSQTRLSRGAWTKPHCQTRMQEAHP